MKTIIIFLLTISCYSQITLNFPLNTIHFEESKYFTEGQGGSKGLVISWTKKHFTAGAGFYENSYGRTSKLIVGGYAFLYKNVDFSVVGGIADNYPQGVKEVMVSFFETKEELYGSRIMPMLMFTSKIQIYNNFGVQINVSPLFINTGVYLNI